MFVLRSLVDHLNTMWSSIILVLIIYCLWTWERKRSKPNEPPASTGGLPLIGQIRFFVGDSIQLWTFLKELSYESLKAGGALTVKVGPKTIYVITDPDDMLTVLNACLEKDPLYDFAKPWLGEGLLTGIPSVWKVHRKLLNPAFSQQVLDGFLGVFNAQARRLAARLAAEEGRGPFDHSALVRNNAMESICRTAMGIDLSDNNNLFREYVDASTKVLNVFVKRFQNVFYHSDLIYRYSSLKREQDEYVKILHDVSNTVLKKRKADYLRMRESGKCNAEITTGLKFKPFMDLLLELSIEKGALDDQEIREEVDNMIIAGEDTTGSVLVFAALLVGSYPRVQERILEELREIFGEEDRDVTKHDLSRLVYLEAVLKESMRVYANVPLIGRKIDADIQLREHTLYSGSSCFILIHGAHRHPAWGADAALFRPERWLDGAARPQTANAFAAFSMGKRVCIGKAYALMSMKTTLVHVLRRYKIDGDHTKMVAKLDSVLKPHSGHFISIEKRK